MKERRAHPRIPAWSYATIVVDDDDDDPERITVVDISVGGAALASQKYDTLYRKFTLVLGDPPVWWFPMEVLSREARVNGTLLHARFATLDAKQQAALRQLVQDWASHYAGPAAGKRR